MVAKEEILDSVDSGAKLLEQCVPGIERGVHWGLDRVRKFLTNTGNPHLCYPTIHVGGTNGKGSVAASLSSVLSSQGHSVGLYTSPHLCSVNERIRIGSTCVDDMALQDLISELGPEMDRCGLSFFEALTALAFHVFQRNNIDIGIIEVGLGGRLDATNVVDPISTVITNIQMDHRAYLGETKEEIAREKLGIVKEGVPLFTSETDKELLDIFGSVCRDKKVPLYTTFYNNPVSQIEIDFQGTSFRSSYENWGEIESFTPLIGSHQAINASLAMAVLEQLPDMFRPSRKILTKGISRVSWPGRIQVEKKNGLTWIFDIAHNKAGASALVDTLNYLGIDHPSVLLISVLGDKDWKGIFLELVDEVDHVILTQSISAPHERRWDLNEVSSILDCSKCEVCPDFSDAILMAETLAISGTVVVTGSAHTVGDVLDTLDFGLYSEGSSFEIVV